MKKTAQVTAKGFTLVELLVVIAIIAILAAVVVLVINPLEVIRRGRDATRLADLASLHGAINVVVQETAESGTTVLCPAATPTACGGLSTASSARANDGTGWVKVDLSTSKTITTATLPVDPVNTTCGTEACHYIYCSDGAGWEIDSNLESEQYASGATDKRANDGGTEDGLYEIGTNLRLIGAVGATGAICTYAGGVTAP